MKWFSMLCALLVAIAGPLCAQGMPDAELPSPPRDGFSDSHGVLRTDPALRQRMVGMIQDLRQQHGYMLYLIIEPSLISTNPGDYAAHLQQQWLPEGGGLVIVFESDTRHLGFGRSLDPGDGLSGNGAGVPAYELVGTVTKAMEEAREADTIGKYLETLMTGISTRLHGYFERKKTPVDGRRSFKLILFTIGFLSLLALCGMGLGWLIGRSGKRKSGKRTFPPVDVPERLSAPYGGGGGGYGSFGNGGP